MTPISTIRARNIASVPWLVVFTALWPIVEALGYSVSKHYHFVQIVGMRYAVHLVVLFAFCTLASRRLTIATPHPWLQILRGLCMFVWPSSFIVAIGSMSGRDLWSMFWIMPLFVGIFAHFVLGERLRLLGWALLAVGYGGALLLLNPDQRALSATALLPLVGALAFAVYVALSRALRDEPISTSLFWTGATVLVCVAPLTLMVWRPIASGDLAAIAGIGTFGLIALFCIDRALQIAPASFVAPFLFGAVAFEVALQVLATRIPPSERAVAGALAIFFVAAWWLASQIPWKLRHE